MSDTLPSNEDLQYGAVEPDSYIALMGLWDLIEALCWFAFWIVFGIPILIIKNVRFRRRGRHSA